MAIDNLNIMTSWLPAWQQTDQYSTKPWCLRSKNLDIFSSSKSVKWTAWSEETQAWSDIIKQVGDLVLKTDGKVYENGVLLVDPALKFPVYDVSYNGRSWTYAPAQRWTPSDLVVKYEWNEWKTFTVFTDRASYTYNKPWYIVEKSFWSLNKLSFEWNNVERRRWWRDETKWLCEWYMLEKTNNNDSYGSVELIFNPSSFQEVLLWLWAYKYSYEENNADPYLDYITRYNYEYRYDAQSNTFVTELKNMTTVNYWEWYDLYNPIYLRKHIRPTGWHWICKIYFGWKKKEWASDYKRKDMVMVDFMWWPDQYKVESIYREDWTTEYADSYDKVNYLPIKQWRTLKKIWEYYWEKWLTTQTLYQYSESWKMNPTWQHITDYDFVQYMARDNPSTMDVVDMISRNERIYMIWNMDWNGYIIPCDLTWWKGTPYIAYGCTFKWATNIDYLMYLVGEDRGVSQLWCYNTQELVPLIWWDKKKVEIDSLTHEKWDRDIVNTNEQYRFDWRLVEYRGDLILSTEDNRLFQYWQTAGGKWWTFIFDVPWIITDLKVDWDNLIVSYEVTVTETDENEQEVEVTYKYNRIYQDDIADKNYLTNREATYPIAIWNHLLEKEESDLYTSYILPSKDCKLEFWGAWNHYHFWSFKVGDPMNWISRSNWLELLRTKKLELLWSTWDYYLEYVEDDWERFTYRLVGDLPQQTSDSQMALARFTPQHTDDWIFTFTEFNHFRKIWEITTDSYIEGEYRFHNLNNKLELPKTHSLQIMVKWTWTSKATPELFTVDLIANQRERW